MELPPRDTDSEMSPHPAAPIPADYPQDTGRKFVSLEFRYTLSLSF